MSYNLQKLQQRVGRAKAATAFACTYKLGKGGFDPQAATPGANCDCSGFVSWVIGISRWQEDKKKPWSKRIPWIETTAITEDARGAQMLFKVISEPVPGCIVVYGDRKVLGIRRQGHVGIVVGDTADPVCVDCSTGRWNRAIGQLRRGSFWIGRGGCYCLLKEDFV